MEEMNIKFPAAVSAAYDSLAPYAGWIEGILGAPKGELLALELLTALDANSWHFAPGVQIAFGGNSQMGTSTGYHSAH